MSPHSPGKSEANIGHACTRRQCELGRDGKIAMRFLSPSLEPADFTFADLDRLTNRFANVLERLGIGPGAVLFTFLPKTPEQFVAFLGTLKAGAVAATLFSNFGPDALVDRLADARAKCVVTRKSLLKKLLGARDRVPSLRCILLIDGDDSPAEGILDYRKLMRESSDAFAAAPTSPDAPSVLHYTSGSTGKPKGVLHAHRSVALQSATCREVLGLGESDVYWCTADQGWVTGTSYGIIGPWSNGITQIHYGGAYDPDRWMTVLERERVSIWYTAPTALRMLMREEASLFGRYDLSALRAVFSVGEPLNPEVVRWGRETLGRDIHDSWFQTETGSIMISNRPGLPIRPGSMGKPACGIEACILRDDGTPAPDGEKGNLCLKAGWDSMFTAYLGNESVYREKFRNGYYLSGDTAHRDSDGYFWFQGRSDDIINTAGHLVSPFEVESALLEMREVVESGVIGAPDDLLFEKVVAFVRLRDDASWSPELELKIRLHVSNRVSSIATPQEIRVADAIPKNRSGKILRRVLRAVYTGSDPGDLSTLED